MNVKVIARAFFVECARITIIGAIVGAVMFAIVLFGALVLDKVFG